MITFIILNIHELCSYLYFNKFSRFIFYLLIFLLKLILLILLLLINTSCIFSNYSDNSSICSWFVIYLLKEFADKSWLYYIKISDFWPCLPDQYIILKLKYNKYLAYCVCQYVNCFVVMKYCKFLWLIRTCIENVESSSSKYYYSKYCIITSNSLLYIS